MTTGNDFLDGVLRDHSGPSQPRPPQPEPRSLRELVDHGPHWSPHPDIRDMVPVDPEWGRSLIAVADVRAALGGATTPDLDAAWQEAEAALPEGASILMGDGRDHPGYGYWATASWRHEDGHLVIVGGKRQDGRHSAAEALRHLTSALIARLTPEATEPKP